MILIQEIGEPVWVEQDGKTVMVPFTQEMHDEAAEAYEKFAERYPDHCENCGGVGCSKCLSIGKCPRCGERHENGRAGLFANAYQDGCGNCGWKAVDYRTHSPLALYIDMEAR